MVLTLAIGVTSLQGSNFTAAADSNSCETTATIAQAGIITLSMFNI